jgi:4-methyl-5(b-hydroxyethyl)-thiazole monophosphate biosynthesis
MPNVLVALAEGFEEIEAVTPIDLLRRAGAEVVLASLGDRPTVTGRSGIKVTADTTLAALTPPDAIFDCLFLPGGPGVKLLRQDARIRASVLRHAAAGKLVAAICAAPTVLLDAGLLDDRRHTAHFSVAAELPRLEPDQKVIVDRRVVTSRGAGTSLEFGLVLIEQLFSAASAAEVRRSICV